MALIYTAQLNPDKSEWIRLALVARGEPEDVAFEKVGAYRFDDPAGEIGVESMIVRVQDRLLQVPFSYRSAPLEDTPPITEAEHSVLGRRWVYDLRADAQALEILRAGLRGEIDQAVLEMHDESGTYLETRQPDVQLTLVGDRAVGTEGSGADASGHVDMPYELVSAQPAHDGSADGPAHRGRALMADGDGFTAAVASLT